MKYTTSTLPILVLLLLTFTQVQSGCTVCSKCSSCNPDVLSDKYLDDIDALLQGKIEQLGYPLMIARKQTSANITYEIQYSNGLDIALALSLQNMQIQLINYVMNPNISTESTSSTSTTSNSIKTTADGYFIVDNFIGNTQVVSIVNYLTTIVKTNLTNFQLTGVEYINSPALLYRLRFKVLPFSTIKPLQEQVTVQSLGQNNYRLINSNYTELNPNIILIQADPHLILNDVWVASINTLIVNKYTNLIGTNPTLIGLLKNEPYYQLVYQVADSNYSFNVLFDYFQSRILQGNITAFKTVVNNSTTVTTTISQNNKVQTQQTLSGSVQSVGGAANGAFSSVLSSAVPAANGVSSSSTSSIIVNSSTSSSQTVGSSATNTPVQTVPVQQIITTQTVTSSPVQSTTSSTSQSTTSSTVQSASNTQTASTTQTAVFQDIIRFSSSSQVISALSFLSSLNQSLSMSQVQSVQKLTNGNTIQYRISVLLNKLGQYQLSNKNLFYQYLINFVPSTLNYSIASATYVNLDSPSFLTPLSVDDIRLDSNIRDIARFLLAQQFPLLTADAKVISVFRDAPYYKLVFQGSGNIQITCVILLHFSGSVQIMNVTSQQKKIVSTTATSTQTTTNSQTSSVNTGSSSTLTQASENKQSGSTQTQNFGSVQNGIPNTVTNNTEISNQLVQQKPSTTSGAQFIPAVVVNYNSQSSQTPLPTIIQGFTGSTTNDQVVNTQNNQNSSITQNNGTVQKVTQNISSNSQKNDVIQQSSTTGQQIYQAGGNIQNSATTTSSVTPAQVQQVTTSSVSPAQVQQVTQNTAVKSTSTVVVSDSSLTQIPSVSQTVNSAQTTDSSQLTLAGFIHFTSVSEPLYQFAIQAISKINATLIQNGFKLTDILYKDIVYKLQGAIVTILFKLQVNTQIYTYQYKGNVNGQIILTRTTSFLPVTTAVDSQTDATSVVSYNGTSYQKASDAICNQKYIIQFLAYLQSTNALYQRKYLIGIFTHPLIPNSFLFRFNSNNQYYNILITATEIQNTLTNSIKSTTQPASQSQTVTQQSNTQQSSQQSNQQTNTQINQQGAIPLVSQSAPQQTTNPINSQQVTTQQTGQQQTQVTTQSNIQQQLAPQIVPQTTSQVNTQVPAQTTTSAVPQTYTQANAQVIQPITPIQVSQKQSKVNPQPIPQINSTQTVIPTYVQVAPQTIQTVQVVQNTQQSASSTVQQQVDTSVQTQKTVYNTIINQTQTTQQNEAAPIINKVQPINVATSASPKQPAARYSTKVDNNCLCYQKDQCLKCAHRFYLQNNICQQVAAECLSYDIITGVCINCIPGFNIVNGSCQPQQITAYYFQDRQCVSCFGNQRMVNKKCVYIPTTNPASPEYVKSKNPLCFTWNGGKCSECLSGTFQSSRGICELIDPFCEVFDYILQVCKNCESGFTLRNGKCFKSQ